MSVLLVDDDRVLLRVLAMHFAEEGYAVHTAPDGHSAVEMARIHRPDVVILDVMMPEVSGIDVCDSIRADPDLASATVLMLTANDAMEEPAFAAGADGFVAKPFDLASLSTQVRELIALRRSQT